MLVYGDAVRVETLGALRDAAFEALAGVEGLPPGIERHAMLVGAFLTLSELVQGVADRAFDEDGADRNPSDERVGLSALVALARSVDLSWQSGFTEAPVPWAALEPVRALSGGVTLRTKPGEGYAYYALYPETFLEAARRSGLGPDTAVIGIRSIGTGLAALVASALGAPAPVTVRPVGHPYRRELRIDAPLADALADARFERFAIVDEGPGLSGSSFSAVADWLAARGVARERIHFFPSHPGDLGPHASAAHRALWAGARRHSVSFDELMLPGPHGLEAWVADLIGPLDGPLEDLSGGRWRRRRYAREAEWPAANVQQEKRKFLARSRGVPWLAKFAGLGGVGAAKLARARRLAAAGLGVEIAGLGHGFLVERWHDDATPLDATQFDRARMVERLCAYLAFRARAFPAPAGSGASLAELAQMATYNVGQALGAGAAAALAERLACAPRLEERVRRIATDGRLHAHEWLVHEGTFLKTDALDHAFAHDLVGCQDVAWDIAGAVVEFGLDPAERERLCRALERESGRAVERELVSLLEPCYLAFQLGAATLAADAIGGDEAIRLRREAQRYAAALSSAAG